MTRRSGPPRRFARRTGVGTCALLIAASAWAIDEDEFERKALRIGCFAAMKDGKLGLIGGGSGFLVGGPRHVVTNHHVAFAKECQAIAVLAGEDVVRLKVLASSETHDLAVLEAASDIPGKEPVPALVLAADVSSRDEVYVVGFPGAVDRMASGDNLLRPTTTRGIVGRKIETAGKTGMLQVDARTVGGNSGGPWLDACGRLVGIHSRGVYERVSQGRDQSGEERWGRLPVGYGYAVQTDHLLPLLGEAKVDYRVAGACGFTARHADRLAWAGALLVGGGVLLRYSPPGRRLWSTLAIRVAPGGASAAAPPRGPHLLGLSGALRDVSVDIGAGAIAIGRDARVSHLALPAGADDVSKRHCLVRTDPDGPGFLLQDCWSTNGTFLASGERLAPGSTRRLPAGARFYLADVNQMFELRAGTGG